MTITQDYSLPLLGTGDHPTKTIDFGSDGLACSLSTHGRLLSISRYHPVHGQIIIEPFAQFSSEKHHDEAYVRKYRYRAMSTHMDPAAGYGLTLAQASAAEPHQLDWSFLGGSTPRCEHRYSAFSITSTYWASSDGVKQDIEVQNIGSHTLDFTASLNGSISINRAAYTQLTPRGDCSLPLVTNRVVSDHSSRIAIENPHLPASICISAELDDVPQSLKTNSHEEAPTPIVVDSTFSFTVSAGEMRHLAITYSVGVEPSRAATTVSTIHPKRSLVSMISLTSLQSLVGERLAFIILRNLDYLLSCCTVPATSPGGRSLGTCIITDHQCLPLGWNRDNYWQLGLLTALLPRLDSIVIPAYRSHVRATIQAVQSAHLKWVYETAQRPEGYWARSFFATGIPKDQVFQLDQQCYPLLELAEYGCRNPGEVGMLVGLASGVVDDVLASIMRHRSSKGIWLFETEETPADDAVAYPFHFSSHVLLWYTLTTLGRLLKILPPGVIHSPVASWAAQIKADTLRFFVTDHPTAGRVFAYLTSTEGQYQFYHDANDLPTVMAPEWGFCSVDDPVWLNTMAFAFSKANEGGWYPGGKFGGLGSVHTRDPWPLGYAQHLVMLCLTKSSDKLVLEKIAASCQFDGMFGEAVDRNSGRVTSKNWFSWPGSFISSIVLRYLI